MGEYYACSLVFSALGKRICVAMTALTDFVSPLSPTNKLFPEIKNETNILRGTRPVFLEDTLWCSGVTPGSAFRNHASQAQGTIQDTKNETELAMCKANGLSIVITPALR